MEENPRASVPEDYFTKAESYVAQDLQKYEDIAARLLCDNIRMFPQHWKTDDCLNQRILRSKVSGREVTIALERHFVYVQIQVDGVSDYALFRGPSDDILREAVHEHMSTYIESPNIENRAIANLVKSLY